MAFQRVMFFTLLHCITDNLKEIKYTKEGTSTVLNILVSFFGILIFFFLSIRLDYKRRLPMEKSEAGNPHEVGSNLTAKSQLRDNKY